MGMHRGNNLTENLDMETVVDITQPENMPSALHKAKHRSRVSNGSKLLPLTDERGVTARRFRDVYQSICADIGGIDRLSEAEKQLARRAATLSAESERQEALWVRDEGKFDLAGYVTMSNALRRILETIGLKRQMRDISPPSLQSYLASKDAQKPE
jgi:hypothetical protein